jgi:predicted nucleotidyltransferase
MDQQVPEFVTRTQKAGGENLISVVLYGSAAAGEFIEKRSDVNLLCVFNRLEKTELEAVSGVVRWWSGELQNRPPMVLTLDELKQSADVFAIETLDIKARHKLLFGRDVLSEVIVPMNLHRVQVEHELRILLLRLRQHFILAHGNSQELGTALGRSASSAVTLLRHALIVVEGRSDASGRQALPRAGQALGIDLKSINSVLDLHDGKVLDSDIEQTYRDYMAALATVIEKIDHAVPKRELQRVGKS